MVSLRGEGGFSHASQTRYVDSQKLLHLLLGRRLWVLEGFAGRRSLGLFPPGGVAVQCGTVLVLSTLLGTG